jgi:hypothetical protein
MERKHVALYMKWMNTKHVVLHMKWTGNKAYDFINEAEWKESMWLYI